MGIDQDVVLDLGERAVAGTALYIASTLEPNAMLRFGAGHSWGPTRYIGVMNPIHLHMDVEALCAR